MMAIIVQSNTFLTLLGGALTPARDLRMALDIAPVLVAADGGADTALAAGHMPDAVIGDMDSISAESRANIEPDRLHHVAEQDSTDFAKCLQRVSAPLILALGFTGGRLDHQLAACTTLVNFPNQRVVMLGAEDICFLSPRELEIDLPIGTRFSLYPMGPVKGTSSGLKYPVDGLTLSPATRVGTSNEVTGPVKLQLERREMLVLVPRDCLGAVITALT